MDLQLQFPSKSFKLLIFMNSYHSRYNYISRSSLNRSVNSPSVHHPGVSLFKSIKFSYPSKQSSCNSLLCSNFLHYILPIFNLLSIVKPRFYYLIGLFNCTIPIIRKPHRRLSICNGKVHSFSFSSLSCILIFN